jgi:lipid II:glycine glycyltransferase (peptidoglycan interpeptide bridge formation enzyme)
MALSGVGTLRAARGFARRPAVRGTAGSLALATGFGLLLGQGWLVDKLLSQNGRVLLRLERLEAAQGHGAHPAADDPDSPARADGRAAFSRVSVAERAPWDAALTEFGGTAMQSWRWGEFLRRIGYTVARVRVDGLLGTGMAQVVFEDLGQGVTAHIPRGPVIVGDWLPVARELFAAVDELAVRFRAVSLTVEPDAPPPSDAAYDALGFVPADQSHYSPGQTVRVPLSDDQALLDQMRARMRRQVRLGRQRGVRVTEHPASDAEAMATFYNLLQDTSRRNGFEIPERDYYADFIAVFGEDAILLLAHLGDLPVAGLIAARVLDEAIYAFGASSTEHRVAGATACLHFHAMGWARRRGCTRYDLWGISPDSGEEQPPSTEEPGQSHNGRYDGYSHFKVGFGGDIITYPPAWQRHVRGASDDASATDADGERIALTIGMATYNDFDGVYFTLQALRLYQDLTDTELLVIDNFGCEHTREFVESWARGRYVLAPEAVGTAAPRDLVFREARGEAVLCCDSHILFAPGAIARLKAYYREHPGTVDLLQGPLLYDDLRCIATHFDPNWSDQMWGTWATDPKGEDPEGEPFDIPMQGLGVFSCRKAAWPGFNPRFRGFGGEEGYIHEKVRQRGGRCLCLPWLRWIHRFGRPAGQRYPLAVEDKLRNYLIGHAELGLDLAPIFAHFAEHLPDATIREVAAEALGDAASPVLERVMATT